MNDLIRNTIAHIQEETGLVGGAYAVIRGDHAEMYCFGQADRETGRPVTEQSFFDIASNSKAFTTMLGAIACDEGMFDWDKPIQQYDPEFDMVDPYAGSHVTGRDMACHRTGLGGHDFIRTKVAGTRRDTVLRAKWMGMSHGFREKYEYNNHMYIALGHTLERIYGKTWEEMVDEKIARPLGMEMRFRGPNCDLSGLDCALPHLTRGREPAERCGYANSPTSGPCGGVRTNLRSLVKWASLMLHRGVYGDVCICSDRAYSELIYPNISCPGEDTAWEMCGQYALAWHVSCYRGHKMIYHSGSAGGFNSIIAFIPDSNCAVVVLLNTNGTTGHYILRDMLLDELLGCPLPDYRARLEPYQREMAELAENCGRAASGRELTEEERAVFCGEFFNPGYDEFTVTARDGGVFMNYGGFEARMLMQEDGTALGYEDCALPGYVCLRPCDGGLMMKDFESLMWHFFTRVERA